MKILDWSIPLSSKRYLKNRSYSGLITNESKFLQPVTNNGTYSESVSTISNYSESVSTTSNYSESVSNTKNEFHGAAVKCGFAFLSSFIVGTTITRSAVLAMPYALMTAGIPLIFQKRKREKTRAEMRELWPELLDHVISGLRSGLSLSETVAGLGNRGPEVTMPIFRTFETELKNGVSFDQAMIGIKRSFNDPMADQVCEVLKFAKESGSRDTSITLRTLADFIRSDLDLRNDIAAKHGWIKNSATLASVAPWILLLILSLQPQTLRAYSSRSGSIVLIAGTLMTGAAYLWMNRVGRIPDSPRVFTQ